MGRINIEIPEDLHKDLRVISAQEDTPIKDLVVQAVESEFGDH